MKHLYRLAAVAISAAFFYAPSALAQNPGTVANHAVAVGKGPGVSGFTSIPAGPNGALFQAQGASSDPAWTTFPLAMLGLCSTQYAFPVYTGTVWGCSTAAAPQAAILNGTLNLNPLAASSQQGLNITTSGPSSGSTAGSIYNNIIQGSWNNTLTGVGSPGSTNCACWSLMQVSASTGSNFAGIESYGLSVGNVLAGANASTSDVVGVSMGVATNFSYGGNLYGGTSAASVGSSGGVRFLIGHEIGVDVETATGVPVRYGLNVDNYGTHTATGMDTAISIQGGNTGGSWKRGITFTNPGGALAPSLATTGTMLSSEAAMTVNTVFDLSNVTATNLLLNSRHSVWTDAGTLVLGDATVNGGLGVKGPVGGNTNTVYQLGASAQWTTGVDGASSNRFYLFNVGLTSNALTVSTASNLVSAPALATNVTGALKGNGSSSAITQAASSDLSDAGAWTSYTPTPSCQTGSGTWGTVTGRYKQIMSKTVVLTITGTLTTQGTCGGTNVAFTLPSAAANVGITYIGAGRETGTTGSLLNIVAGVGASSVNVLGASGAPPFGSGSIYNISLTYELP